MESLFETLETCFLSGEKSVKFVVFGTSRSQGRTFHLVAEALEMAAAMDTGGIPALFGFEEVGENLIPLDSEGMAKCCEGLPKGSGTFVSIAFPEDRLPNRFEVEEIASLDGDGMTGNLVALHNVADNQDVRLKAQLAASDGTWSYVMIPEQYSREADDILRFLWCRRRALWSSPAWV